MDFAQICRTNAASAARDGEFLTFRVRDRRLPYGYALQVLDVDRLDTKHNGEYGNNRIIMGVEVDDVMRPVAYHLLTTHPGDGTYLSRAGQRYERVLARDVFHGGVGDRPEQVRYMPWAHTAMLRLEMLGKFQTAAVVAARSELPARVLRVEIPPRRVVTPQIITPRS